MPTSSPTRKFSIFHKNETQKARRASTQASPASCQNDLNIRPETAPLRQMLKNYTTPTFSSILRSKGKPANDQCPPPGELSPSTSASSPGINQDLLQSNGGSHEVITPIMPSVVALLEPSIRSHHDSGNPRRIKQASLMGIPVELRLMIFRYVFPPGQPQGSTEITVYCAPALRVLGSSHVQLSRVNWQIYEETKELLYGQTFVFLSREAMTNFFATIYPPLLLQLRAIRMRPRITDWSAAIKSLVLPPAASLTIHWHITKVLWEALVANETLDYREVTLIPGREEQLVVFEPLRNTTCVANMPTYQHLEMIFSLSPWLRNPFHVTNLA